MDFTAEWRWKRTEDEMIVSIQEDQETIYFEYEGQNNIYRRSVNQYPNCIFNQGVLGTNRRRNSISIIDHTELQINERLQVNESVEDLPQEILDAIQNRTAVAATDSSIDGNCLAMYWTITTMENNIHVEGGVESTM